MRRLTRANLTKPSRRGGEGAGLVENDGARARETTRTRRRRHLRCLPRVVRGRLRGQGIRPAGPEGGEELYCGAGTLVRLAQLCDSRCSTSTRRAVPSIPDRSATNRGGRIAVQVAPATSLRQDSFQWGDGQKCGWSRASTKTRSRPRRPWRTSSPDEHTGVSLVLGAGNVASLGPRDVLDKLFAEGKVVVLKANPVNDYLVPYWRRAMAALIDAGYLRIVHGGAQVGVYLTHHEQITDIHVTGSDKTLRRHRVRRGGEGAPGRRERATRHEAGELANSATSHRSCRAR